MNKYDLHFHFQSSKGRFCGSYQPPLFTTPSGIMAVKLYSELEGLPIMPYFSAQFSAHKELNG